MYPFLRVFYTQQRAKSRTTLDLYDVGVFPASVHLSDLDPYAEMNNARYLNVMEMGRLDFSVRMGLMKIMRKNNWGFTVAGCSIRYRKRLTALQKFEVHTSVAGIDDRWLFVEQDIFRDGVQHTGALFRTAVISKQGLVPTKKIFEEMGLVWEPKMPDWVFEWDKSDQSRPWSI
jgi:acyl-CoA thioesterase FadM